jgi:hypothetical protein
MRLVLRKDTWTLQPEVGWSFIRFLQTDPSREAAPPPGTSL